MWRYAPLLPPADPLTLGEGGTPLVPSLRIGPRLGIDVAFKLEGANPTGSFKDRGAAVLVAVLRSAGAAAVADDSSGNAGAALAAYAARAGLRAVLFAPAHASGPKLAQIAALGAELVRVSGPRERATRAVEEACRTDPTLFYASHNTSPYFVAGLTTVAYEWIEDRGRAVPDHVVVPAGGGGLFLGIHQGFAAALRLGWIDRVPQVHIAQPAACAPLVRALHRGDNVPHEPYPGMTVAEGTRIPTPARGQQVVALLRAAGGNGVAVEEDAIHAAQRRLAREEGIHVEPTAALAVAALPALLDQGTIRPGQQVGVVLTASGLKAGG
ncbi:MAG: Threonine synthase [Candidatus Bipolaricaulis sibiricus]|uniref:Threonine synthase n=1 Tax=Bipolaricaulis sibiricus TaxID=2501609 RepID=A0A410FSZ2_BIPS1|nr:MAG: Threonine synthase [Candidatus Bipolaricaulis sibiricus]